MRDAIFVPTYTLRSNLELADESSDAFKGCGTALLRSAVSASDEMPSGNRDEYRECSSVFPLCHSGSGQFSETRFDCGSHPRPSLIFPADETCSSRTDCFDLCEVSCGPPWPGDSFFHTALRLRGAVCGPAVSVACSQMLPVRAHSGFELTGLELWGLEPWRTKCRWREFQRLPGA